MMDPGVEGAAGSGAAGNGAAGRDKRLRELADGALRRAARAASHDDVVDEVVRELIQRACTVAHERGLRAEQVLLLFKESWRGLPEGRRLPRQDGDDVLARTITVCIEEYYARGNGRG